MITEAEAENIAYRFINKPDGLWPNKPEMIITQREETEEAYIFYWTSSKYLKTNNIEDMLAGNGPIVVLKKNGNHDGAGSAPPIDKRIKETITRLNSN